MKKTYKTPRLENVQLITEGIIADSLGFGTTPGTGQGTQGRGWNFEDWSIQEDDLED